MRLWLLTVAAVFGVIGALLLGGACSSPEGPSRTYTLSATLAHGYEISGPYAATLTGPNGFSCSMSQSQQSVTCAPATSPALSA
jgi:hypothetical protein